MKASAPKTGAAAATRPPPIRLAKLADELELAAFEAAVPVAVAEVDVPELEEERAEVDEPEEDDSAARTPAVAAWRADEATDESMAVAVATELML